MFTQESERTHDTIALNVISMTKDFSRSQAVTYDVKVVISRKWCNSHTVSMEH